MRAILHNIRSMHNVGSMFRTADAAGIEKIYVTGITSAPVDEWGRSRPQLTKVSLGAERTVPWEKCASATRLIEKLKKQEYFIIAVDQHKKALLLSDFCAIFGATKAYNKISGRSFYCKHRKLGLKNFGLKNIVLMVGNEVRGLSPAILKRADAIVEIPMRGTKESLNVAVAFGVAAYWFLFLKPR